MATLRSLGVHTPSGFAYLVAEQVLPEDVSEAHYRWDVCNEDGPESLGEEEVLWTDYCVVYSRGSVVQRVFRFEVEEQKIVQAVLTWFHSDDVPYAHRDESRVSTFGEGKKPLLQHAPILQRNPAPIPNLDKDSTSQHDPYNSRGRSRALVVLLKFQAHVFFLAGSSHVVNLPFEVEKAFAAPRGLILQRRAAPRQRVAPTPVLPSVPQNSFLGSQSFGGPWSQPKQSFAKNIPSSASRRSNTVTTLLEDLAKIATPAPQGSLPRLYSFTDPLSEIGIVVTPTSSLPRAKVRSSTAYRGSSFEALDEAEEVLYVSSNNELPPNHPSSDKPLLIVVTCNFNTRKYSFWGANYVDPAPASSRFVYQDSGPSTLSRRRSSFNPGSGTGATTPTIRPRDGPRESFGGAMRSKNVSASFNAPVSQGVDHQSSQTAEDALASQMDPDFGLGRQPDKDQRRVSSLLSRADLSTSFDRFAFNELAANRGTGNSFAATGRRGQSFGGYSDRGSFGGATFLKSRLSTPGSVSHLSVGVESVDAGDDDTIMNEFSEMSYDYDSKEERRFGASNMLSRDLGLQEPLDRLKQELVLVKFEELPLNESKGQHEGNAGFDVLDVQDHYRPHAFTVISPITSSMSDPVGHRLFVHVMNQKSRDHLELECAIHRTLVRSVAGRVKPSAEKDSASYLLAPCVEGLRRSYDHLDALRISDGEISRVLCLGLDVTQAPSLSMYAGWVKDLVTTVEVGQLKLFNPYSLGASQSPLRKAAGSKRTVKPPQRLVKLSSPGPSGLFDLIDAEGCRHRVQLQLRPRNERVFKALEVCRFVLPGFTGEALLALWWSITKDLNANHLKNNEWRALAIALLSLAVDLLDKQAVRAIEATPLFSSASQKSTTPSNPRRTGHAYSPDAWDKMWKSRKNGPLSSLETSPAWSWLRTTVHSQNASQNFLVGPPSPTQKRLGTSSMEYRSKFIIECNEAARRACQKPFNQKVISLCRQAPGANQSKQGSRALALVRICVSLHLLREEQKLDIVAEGNSFPEREDIGPVLAQVNGWLGWEDWAWREGGYYDLDSAGESSYLFEDARIKAGVDVPPELWPAPPSIFQWVEQTLESRQRPAFPTLSLFISDRRSAKSEEASLKYVEGYISGLTPRTLAMTKFLSQANKHSPTASVQCMADCGINKQLLETLPDAISASLREAIVRCQADPPTTWSSSLYTLVGRQDLNLQSADDTLWRQESHSLAVTSAVATRDVRTICQATEQVEGSQSSLLEADRFMITRLIFNEDRRFIEAARILEPLRPAVAECIPHPSWSEAEYLEAQKEVMQWVMIRTFALPSGQAMLSFESRRPLLTEKYPLHGFTTVCLMKPMNNTVSADRTNYTEERFCWAFFHAGVSAGLSISKHAEGIDTSWIVFNKPSDLSNKHAGLLLALGLNGHLRSIAKWLAFKYLTPKHTMTSIGLLLGLSASFLGTMDQLVTRLLSVHVTRMLPPGAAELNLSPLTQTTGLMGMGLVYYNTQHRRMSEVMLSEIEHIEVEDPSLSADILRDEGYRLAAGFALGYINIGKGDDLKGLHDMRLIERLLTVAVGPRPVHIVHVLDRATAGATVAIALIFMKTGNEAVARKIDVPDTLPQFDYVRPDIFLLRTLAKHLIMWEGISADDGWILDNLPPEYRHYHTLENIRTLKSSLMPFYNIVAGLLWSTGLRYAGSGNTNVRDFLIRYLDQFIRICELPAISYDTRLARNTVRNCQDVVALATATVMAGTGDLDVFRRLRLLHGRIHPDTPFGSHLAAHMALGALFLGGGSYTFGTSNLAIASLICAFYPLFPTNVLDNKAHLQAFRHFWALAAEPRCLIVRDVDTRRAISLPVIVTSKTDHTLAPKEIERTAPCLLPALDTIAQIRTSSPEYWPVTLDFAHNPAHLLAFQRTQTIHVRRRPAHDAHDTMFAASLAARADADSASATAAAVAGVASGGGLPLVLPRQMMTTSTSWDWIARLEVFSRAQIDSADWALVLPPDATSAVYGEMAGTVVDVRLALGRAADEGWDRDELWNLRVLFAWAEKVADAGGRLKWLGREVVDSLRARIMERAGAL